MWKWLLIINLWVIIPQLPISISSLRSFLLSFISCDWFSGLQLCSLQPCIEAAAAAAAAALSSEKALTNTTCAQSACAILQTDTVSNWLVNVADSLKRLKHQINFISSCVKLEWAERSLQVSRNTTQYELWFIYPSKPCIKMWRVTQLITSCHKNHGMRLKHLLLFSLDTISPTDDSACTYRVIFFAV